MDIFRDLIPDELLALDQSTRMVTVRKGRVLYEQGDTGQALFLLKQGSVRLMQHTAAGKRLELAVLVPHTFFGEMPLLSERMRHASAEAIEDCLVCVMSAADIERLALAKPQVALRMLEILGRRLAEAEDRLQDLAYRSVAERLASLLLRLATEPGNVVEGVTHQELGDMVGAYRETVPKRSTSSSRRATSSWRGAGTASWTAWAWPPSCANEGQYRLQHCGASSGPGPRLAGRPFRGGGCRSGPALEASAEEDPRMARVCVFDVIETMLDLRALDPPFERAFGDAGARQEWFQQLLQSALVTTVTGSYADFGRVGQAALEMIAARRERTLTTEERQAILGGVRQLPPHPEVEAGLQRLRDAGVRLAALTNSTEQVAEAQLTHAGLRPYFEQVLSADAVRRFKPAPEPYRMAAERLGVETGRVRLIAAHAWDVAGALRAGCAAAFVARPGKVLDPLAPQPDVIGADMQAVVARILEREFRGVAPP